MKKERREIVLEFDKIVGEGKALGRSEGKVVFCYGVLPGETARVRTTYEKKSFAEAELLEIIKPSAHRVPPKEEHYLSCSPWQVMDYPYQTEIKKTLIEEQIYETSKQQIKLNRFYAAEKQFGYRTKVEFSFTGERGDIGLAFHKRGNFRAMWRLDEGCALMSDEVNAAAVKIAGAVNAAGLAREDLKTLVIREAKNPASRIAALFVTRKDIEFKDLDIKSLGLDGFLTVYSDPAISSGIVTQVLDLYGKDFVTQEFATGKFMFGFDCFFQNNTEVFAHALEEIRSHAGKCEKLVDLYSGVGVIGLSLRDAAKQIIAVESSSSSAKYAEINAQLNNAANFKTVCSLSERADEKLFEGTDLLVLDPPRAGLHNKVTDRIMEILPKKIIYLSCNPITQGRDLSLFAEKYKVTYAAGFDFYPNTPHAETLMVLEPKGPEDGSW